MNAVRDCTKVRTTGRTGARYHQNSEQRHTAAAKHMYGMQARSKKLLCTRSILSVNIAPLTERDVNTVFGGAGLDALQRVHQHTVWNQRTPRT